MKKKSIKNQLIRLKEEGYIIRAIYLGDIKYITMPVFELDYETMVFFMLEDSDFRYPLKVIKADKNWRVFKVKNS